MRSGEIYTEIGLIKRVKFRVVWWSWSSIRFQLYLFNNFHPNSSYKLKELIINWEYRKLKFYLKNENCF